ncbi:MAG: hypothetical protein HOC21_07645, partial [Phycisphaerae bacterium]|nr:hypothetical protein [Phycisphaerae bacterium]
MTTLAVLFSGGGRTVLNLLNKIEDGELNAKIVLAIASKNTISGIDILADRGLDIAIARQDMDTQEDANNKISAWLNEAKTDLILLCGYLSLLPIE